MLLGVLESMEKAKMAPSYLAELLLSCFIVSCCIPMMGLSQCLLFPKDEL